MTRFLREGSLLPVASLIVAGVILHGPALGGWWLNDDPQVILHALRHTPMEVLFTDAWTTLSGSNFTPLVTLSFDLDLSLGGIDPVPFYLHQVIAVILCALLVFALTRRFTDRTTGWGAGALFLLMPLTWFAARTLMIRHYVEGLALALAALLLWEIAGRRASHFAAAGSATLYLLATLAKEVYAPLPLLMIAISLHRREPWRGAAVRLFPVVIAAEVYLFWRRTILGSTGGYGAFPALESILALPGRIVTAAGGPAGTVLWIIGLTMILLAMHRNSRSLFRTSLAGAAIIVMLLLPLVAVADAFDARHAFAVSAAFAMVVPLALSGLSRTIRAAGLAILTVLAATATFTEAGALAESRTAMRAEGLHVWNARGGEMALLAGSQEWYLDGLLEMRSVVEQRDVDVPLYLSLEGVAIDRRDSRTIHTIDGTTGRLRPLMPREIEFIKSMRARFDPSLPIDLVIRRADDGVVSWRLGPEASRWQFLTYPRYDEYEIPPDGWLRLSRPTSRQWFRVRRVMTDGRWSVSEPLELPIGSGQVRWSSDGAKK